MSALWTDALRSACAERCAGFGDPPCREVKPHCAPCDDCLVACGFEPAPEPLDPCAVVRALL